MTTLADRPAETALDFVEGIGDGLVLGDVDRHWKESCLFGGLDIGLARPNSHLVPLAREQTGSHHSDPRASANDERDRWRHSQGLRDESMKV
jgi:hypothetical protein